MRNRDCTFLIPAVCVTVLLYIIVYQSPGREYSLGSTSAQNAIWRNYSAWHECISKNITAYRGDPNGLWGNLWKGIKKCEIIDEMVNLPIKDFHNSDETKRSMIPKIDIPSVIITLGIGHDTLAEQKLIKAVPAGSEFYGADPMHEINEKLFVDLPGKYFPFAVGAEAGLDSASVLNNNTYSIQTVVNVDIIYFLTKIVKRKFIDDLWIDAEGAEYGIFDFFRNGGVFDNNDIVLCQFNIEIHKPDVEQKQKFHDFIFNLVDDKRYAFYRPVQGSHMRLYMINFNHEECITKYLL